MTKLEIIIKDIGENQCIGVIMIGSRLYYTTSPQICSPDALRAVSEVLCNRSVDILRSIEHSTKA